MLGKKSFDESVSSGNLNTIIGKGSTFEGTMKVQSTLRVDGKIKGNVTTSDSIVIGKDGSINGDVTVRNAIIGGKLRGKLVATGKVVLESNSVFNGELKTTKLVIDEGAVFEGNCSMSAGENVDIKPVQKSVSAILEKKEGETKSVNAQ